MMREIYRHGPVVAGFEAGAALYTFSGRGVFSAATAKALAAQATTAGMRPRVNAAAATAGVAAAAEMTAVASDLVEAAEAVSLLQASEMVRAFGDVEDDTAVDDTTRAVGGAPTATTELASFFERTNHAVLVVGWGVDEGVKYWWAQNTWGADWGQGGYFKMARGEDEFAFESMAVAVDVDSALPLPLQQSPRDLTDDASDEDLREQAEVRRRSALRRRTNRAPYGGATTLTPELQAEPPPSPSPRYARIEEPREHGVGAWGAGADSPQHHSLLDALAHFAYGG